MIALGLQVMVNSEVLRESASLPPADFSGAARDATTPPTPASSMLRTGSAHDFGAGAFGEHAQLAAANGGGQVIRGGGKGARIR